MHRPAAKRTHSTFDEKTVRCDFLDNNVDNKRVVSAVNFLKCVAAEIVLLLIDSDILQGSVATHLQCGRICSNNFITNCLLILRVKTI